MKKSVELIHINNLSIKRQEYVDKYQNSYDEKIGEYGDYTIDEPEEIDFLAGEILKYIKVWRHLLPFEFIIEELTKLGWSPSLLYDDNGHFAISGDGMQTISENKEDCQMYNFVEKDMWKDTIREALNYYLDID
jgi:hypothetical protein